jgi:hypothetical protein
MENKCKDCILWNPPTENDYGMCDGINAVQADDKGLFLKDERPGVGDVLILPVFVVRSKADFGCFLWKAKG